MRLTLKQRHHLASATDRVLTELHHVKGTLESRLDSPVPVPTEVSALIEETSNLKHMFQVSRDQADLLVDLDPSAQGLLRSALAMHRRLVAGRVQATQQHLATSREIETVAAELAELDDLLNLAPLDSVLPRALPRLADYLTARARERVEPSPTLAAPVTDPKHQILLSASMIENDIDAYQRECEDRHLPLAVVFADIDKFKAYNSSKGNVYVDRFVLPPILAAVEASCFGHGRAYRHGGDEFLLILPNVTDAMAVALSKRLAAAVAAVNLDGMPHPPRLSIGIWLTRPESPLTATELVDRAATANRRSKEMGRNLITLHVETSGTPTEFRYATEV